MRLLVRFAPHAVLLAATLGLLCPTRADAEQVVAHRPPATAPKVAPPLTADAKAVVDLRAEGQREVAALLRMLAAARDERTRRDVQLQISAAKRTTDIKVLRLHAAQARAHGDLSGAQEYEMYADAMEHPKPAAEAAGPAQSPNKLIGSEGRRP
jgi:hypothetical protein